MAEIVVRAATREDAEAMVQLTAGGWRQAYRGMVPDAYIEKLPIPGWRHDISSGLRKPRLDAFSLIAEADGEAAGYCFVAAPGREEPEDSKHAELVALYVDQAHWRAGIGRRLLERAVDRTRELEYRDMHLWTFDANERAKSFYEATGWEADEEAKRPHEASGAPAIRFNLSL
jgi:GNAT superfamily N-acetyltransferase